MTTREVAAMKKRAERGDAHAMMGMGCNRYCAEKYDEAVAWYEKAATKGNVQAMVNLGYCYYYGRLGKVDYATAYKWYSKALVYCADEEGDHPDVLFKLGDHYRHGYFVESERGFKCKVAFGDMFAPALQTKARKAVDEAMMEFRTDFPW